MPEAFVLFKTLPSRERDVYLRLSNHESVVEVHALYGEYDLIVRVSSSESGKLSGMLMSDFRQIDGVKDTQTLIAVEYYCLLYTSPSPRDRQKSRMPSSA